MGIRWKCSQCYDFDLCTQCYMSNKHSEGHKFVRYDGQLRFVRLNLTCTVEYMHPLNVCTVYLKMIETCHVAHVATIM